MMSNTMAGVAATAPDPIMAGFPGVFTLLKSRANTNPQARLERLSTLKLGDRPTLLVCLNSPEPHIRVLWGGHFVTPSFVEPTPEDGNILAFA